jgi:heme/copper-type cytochrome/quinol oxidase subunit 2
MMAGLAVWGCAFNALYGVQALGCAAAWQAVPFGPSSQLRALLVIVLAVFLSLHAAVIAWAMRRRDGVQADGGERLSARVALAVAWIGLAATLVTGAPALLLSLCGSPVGP